VAVGGEPAGHRGADQPAVAGDEYPGSGRQQFGHGRDSASLTADTGRNPNVPCGARWIRATRPECAGRAAAVARTTAAAAAYTTATATHTTATAARSTARADAPAHHGF